MSLRDYDRNRSMQMEPEAVLDIAESYDLAITIRPDGSIIGLPDDLDRLRYEYQKLEL